jgi:hypothetical protein
MGDKEQMSISISFSGKEPAIKKGRVHDVWAAATMVMSYAELESETSTFGMLWARKVDMQEAKV